MAKTLSLSDLLRLQFSTLESMDLGTLSRLEPVLRNAQNELRAELDKYARGTFSHAQRRHTLTLINRALVQLHNRNISEMQSWAQEFNEFGIEVANREVRDFQREAGLSIPNVRKDKVSLQHNDFLINTMQASLEKHSVDTRLQVSRGLTDAVIQRKSGYEVTGRLGKYIDLKKYQIQRIVRTEMSRIFNQTKLLTYGEFNKSNFNGTLMKRMFHPMDSRTAEDSKQWAQADPAIPMHEPFRLKLRSGKVQEGMTPPMRPNDRAVLMPFHKSWKE